MQYIFEQVYNQYKEKIWALISKYAYKEHEREDLFQEIFLKVYKNIDKFRGDSDIGTWIYRVAVNESINFLKRKKRQENFENILQKLPFFKKHDEIKEAEENIYLWQPLKALNEKQKLILIMAEVEEMKLEDIAKYLNISVGTVKSNLFRAKEILRKQLRKENLNG